MDFITNSPEETEAVGAALGKILQPGTILAYRGDLGAGKTAFTRGLARGLGCPGRVTSPTFTIVNEYRHGKIPLFHFDVYRLESSEEMYDIGWEDYLSQQAVIVVEWAKNISDIFDDELITIEITKDPDISHDYRKITIKGA